MDQLTPSLPAPKTRRRFTPEFKAMILKACKEPGNSVAGVAQKYNLNANLLHKWRRQFEQEPATDFIPLTVTTPLIDQRDQTVRIELPNGTVIHWPADRIMESVDWLKVMQS
ncbi:IS66-like element accessory protein TnpA [Endozoicomonas montiporae]|uniref:IS66 family transposase n=1 Tax=Endozoicomonas montiporae CL-33 TaxID=570277 RepID=A0A142B8I6_9GAMM|nr:transposase [Endozoicomonas montiporae]AMO55062.1 IS66 family transposase [Endozoicomonas montiporae CL-33]